MKLPVFTLVEQTIDLLKARRAELEASAAAIQAYFGEVFSANEESLVTLTTRVKGEDSLKEKILRKNLYKKYSDSTSILDNLSDLIGIRVECRFLADEVILSKTLQDRFTIKADDGYYYAEGNPNIRLEMEEMQPQIQTNGFKIYRIDGMYGPVGQAVRFELQIKALVHVFWAEVEHEIIYKNNSYMLMDAFMKELLSLAYANLSLVDNQLYLIYQQIQKQTEPIHNYIQDGAVHDLFAKAISDMFYLKMQESLGFTINFRGSCDILSRYIIDRQLKSMLAQEPGDGVRGHFSAVNQIMHLHIDFDTVLQMEDEYTSDIPFNSILGEHFAMQMNLDYEWNVLFRMLFALESTSKLSAFSQLIAMIHGRLMDDTLYAELFASWPRHEAERFRQWVLVHAAHQMIADGSIHIIHERSLAKICRRIRAVSAAMAAAEPPPSYPRVQLWQESDGFIQA